MNNLSGKDLSKGSIPKNLLFFSLPMFIGNFLNTGYSFINTIWVGNILGEDAVGASTVVFPILFILIAFAAGSTIATTILISQFYGAKNFKMLQKVINNSFIIVIFMGIILSILGIIFSDLILRMMNTPPEIFNMASSYLKIIISGFIFQYFSFLIISILRGIGDTITPLIFLIFSTFINAILDPVLIIGIGPFPKLGLNGAALASVISMFFALIFGIIYLYKKDHFLKPDFKNFKIDKKIMLLILKIGFPSIIQQSLISIGAAFITSFVNSFGNLATNAFGACSRIDNIALMPAMSLSMAVSAMTGQNLGAKKPERIKSIFKWGILIGLSITSIIMIIAQIFPVLILHIFGFKLDEVVKIGIDYLRIVSIGYIFFTIMFVSNGIINGAGATLVTMFFSIISLWVIRVPLAAILSKTELGLRGIWLAILSSFIVVAIVSLTYYFSGRWKKAYYKIHHPAPVVEISE